MEFFLFIRGLLLAVTLSSYARVLTEATQVIVFLKVQWIRKLRRLFVFTTAALTTWKVAAHVRVCEAHLTESVHVV